MRDGILDSFILEMVSLVLVMALRVCSPGVAGIKASAPLKTSRAAVTTEAFILLVGADETPGGSRTEAFETIIDDTRRYSLWCEGVWRN